MAKGNIITWALLGIVAFLAAPSLIGLVRGPAETPGVFEAGYSLQEATQKSASAGKPMLVLVTADWCPPCQALKRGALRTSASRRGSTRTRSPCTSRTAPIATRSRRSP